MSVIPPLWKQSVLNCSECAFNIKLNGLLFNILNRYVLILFFYAFVIGERIVNPPDLCVTQNKP